MECPFCNFEKEIRYRLLYQTKHFYLIPDLGAFIEGYLLITTKEHFDNYSHVPPDWFDELDNLEKMGKKFLQDNFSQPIIQFEHGACSNGKKAGGCVEHAHLALVATQKNPYSTIVNQLGEGHTISNLKELSTLYQNNKLSAYLLYKDNINIKYWDRPNIISQYIRRLLNDGGKNGFDWRTKPHHENIVKVQKKWQEWIKKHL